eukprot:11033053-Alexandrium_andersonii.AAC.1
MASHVLAGMDALVALRSHYEQHFAACCERVSMESMQLCFAPEIGSIARDLERVRGCADWGDLFAHRRWTLATAYGH